jgi:hypothetical protein
MERIMKNPITLTDCLHNCDRACVSTLRRDGTPGQIYGRGIINGATAAIMAVTGKSFEDALDDIRQCLSQNTQFDPACVPASWKESWDGKK